VFFSFFFEGRGGSAGNSSNQSEGQTKGGCRNCREEEWKEGTRKCIRIWCSRCVVCFCSHSKGGRLGMGSSLASGFSGKLLHKAEWHNIKWNWQSLWPNHVSQLNFSYFPSKIAALITLPKDQTSKGLKHLFLRVHIWVWAQHLDSIADLCLPWICPTGIWWQQCQ